MTNTNSIDTARRGIPWRLIGWSIPVVLLLLPLVLRAPWTVGDFVFAALAMGFVGVLLELVVRSSTNLAYRAGAALAVAAAFLLVWVNGAVGFLGDEGNPANLLFFGVIAVALLGAVAARFRAGGMALAMLAAAALQIAIGALAVPLGWGAPGYAGIYEAVLGTGMFATLWLLSAGLFRKAAQDRA
jgi:hypothetical protein